MRVLCVWEVGRPGEGRRARLTARVADLRNRGGEALSRCVGGVGDTGGPGGWALEPRVSGIGQQWVCVCYS